MKVLLNVPLSPFSGYGNDGIGLVRAFLRWGADVYLQPSVVQAPLPPDVAELLTKPLEAPFDLFINHHDPAALISSEEQKRSASVTVAWTMWEYSNFGNLPGRSNLKKNLKYFDALVGYDPVSSDCLREYAYKNQSVLTVQGGFWPEDWPESHERDWYSDRFGFCMVGQLHMRKDPFVAIEAFNELKQDPNIEFEGAELHLKTNLPGLSSRMEEVVPKLRVHYAVWQNELLYKFYESQHVLLAPSRGEGKNMPALEMQATGGTVIATNWGGHTQWLNKDYNYPLDYTLAPVDPEFPTTLNARADVEHLKELMLHAYQNRDEARRKGELAAQVVPKLASWDTVIERLLLQLRDSTPNGEKLWAAAQSCRQGRPDGEM
jgi:glycosyltransferase involved in cell wall biosynthesis